MGSTRLTLSIEDIEAQIEDLRRQANEMNSQAAKLQENAQKLFAKANNLGDLIGLAMEVGTPVPNARPRVNRKLQIAKYIIENGPQTRKALIEKTGIPEGTINSEMRHRDLFIERPGNLWDVTDTARAASSARDKKSNDGTQTPIDDEFDWINQIGEVEEVEEEPKEEVVQK